MEEKKSSRKRTLIFYGVLALVVLVSVGIYFWKQQTKEPETVAVVTYGSAEILRADLSKDAKYLIQDGVATEVSFDLTLSSLGAAAEHDVNFLEIRDGRVSCTEANCPDLTCTHIAALSKDTDGMPIACLPHGVIVVVE